MCCCKSSCTYAAIIIGFIAGIILGILCALGFVSIGIVFWVYLVFGVLGTLLAPIYASLLCDSDGDLCFYKYRGLYLTATIGTVITSAIGLLIAPVASLTVISIVGGAATLFFVMELVTAVCISECICGK